MIRPEINYLIDRAVYDEQHYIVTEKPQYHNDHEAYAVLLEEVEEVKTELEEIVYRLRLAWNKIKEDEPPCKEVASIKRYAKRLAAEAVQAAAVSEKFFLRKGEEE